MHALVVDSSVTLGFLLPDEQDPLSTKVLMVIQAGWPIFVPAHWAIEVANGLLMAERRKRSSPTDTHAALHLAQTLSVTVDVETASHLATDTTALARQYGLTIYDAAYLELAMRRGAKLATSDRDLVKAAKASGVAVFAG
jgi:predicted nucleic acid-binding protein